MNEDNLKRYVFTFTATRVDSDEYTRDYIAETKEGAMQQLENTWNNDKLTNIKLDSEEPYVMQKNTRYEVIS